jgi:hypothetical protein
MKEYAQQQYEKGKIAALTGEEKPSKGYYAITAYEEAKGDVTADTEYRKALQEYFNSTYAQSDPEEFQQGLETLTNEFLNGRTENFLKGFAPKAQALEQQVIGQYHSYLAEEHHRESLNIVGGLSDTGINEVINSTLQERYGDTGLTSVEDVVNNPSMFSTIKYDDTFKETLAKNLRSKLTNIQQRGLDMGLNRKEISAKYVEFLGRYAIRFGMPEVLDMAYEQDESGISLAGGELSNTIESYKKQAENSRNQLVLAADKAAEERAKMQRNAMLNEVDTMTLNISMVEDPKERSQMASEYIQQLLDNDMFKSLNNTDYRRVMKTLTDFQGDKFNFPDESNQQIYAHLFAQAQEGTLTMDMIEEERNQGELSLADWKELRKKVISNQEAEQLFQDEAEKRDIKRINRTIDNTVQFIVGRQFGDVWNNEQEAAAIEENLHRDVEKYKDENGRYPDHNTFVREILNPLLESQGTVGSYSDLLREAAGNTEADVTSIDIEAEREKIRQDVEAMENYREDQANVGPLESIGEFFGLDTSKSNWGRAREIPEGVNPNNWGLDLEQAYTNITSSLESGHDINSIHEKITSLMSPEAADYYIYNYLYGWSQNNFSRLIEEEDVPFSRALTAIRDHMKTEWGVPENIITEIMSGIGADSGRIKEDDDTDGE